MRVLSLLLTVIVLFLPHLAIVGWAPLDIFQQSEVLQTTISSPVAGQVIQGAAVIRGSTNLEEFKSYEVDFAYSANSELTWFLIAESTNPIQDGILAVWDTSTITDGDYDLRLVVTPIAGDQVKVSVFGVRVRNYTPIEMDTPMPTLPQVTMSLGTSTLLPTTQVTLTPQNTSMPIIPTPLPTNPADLSASQVLLSFGKGAAFTIGIFALLGAYVGIRSALHQRK